METLLVTAGYLGYIQTVVGRSRPEASALSAQSRVLVIDLVNEKTKYTPFKDVIGDTYSGNYTPLALALGSASKTATNEFVGADLFAFDNADVLSRRSNLGGMDNIFAFLQANAALIKLYDLVLISKAPVGPYGRYNTAKDNVWDNMNIKLVTVITAIIDGRITAKQGYRDYKNNTLAASTLVEKYSSTVEVSDKSDIVENPAPEVATEAVKNAIYSDRIDLEVDKATFEAEIRALELAKVSFESEMRTLELAKTAFGVEKKALETEKTTLAMDKAALETEKTTLAMDKAALETEKTTLAMDKAALETDKTTLAMDKAANEKLAKREARGASKAALLLEIKDAKATISALQAENKQLRDVAYKQGCMEFRIAVDMGGSPTATSLTDEIDNAVAIDVNQSPVTDTSDNALDDNQQSTALSANTDVDNLSITDVSDLSVTNTNSNYVTNVDNSSTIDVNQAPTSVTLLVVGGEDATDDNLGTLNVLQEENTSKTASSNAMLLSKLDLLDNDSEEDEEFI